MTEMTTHERMTRMLEHREADRVPVTDSPWSSTVNRWHREGMPDGVRYQQFFDLDWIPAVSFDNSPRFPEKTIEETDEYRIATTKWGTTLRRWKDHGGVPEFLDHTIIDADSWAKVRDRVAPAHDRINWERIRGEYATWKEQGAWTMASFWFGFDVTHAWVVGTERVLIAMASEPAWLVDMWNRQLDVDIALCEMVLDAGYRFDALHWPDDMGYKLSQFFSLDMYRELLRPVHQRACQWAHSKGLKVVLHSCGDIRPFVPDLIEIGVDVLNPIEVKAGMDPVALKRQYGDRLAFYGGLNAALYGKPEELYAQMEQIIPAMKAGGGYIAATDHSVPDSVGIEDFRRFVELAKKLGTYA
jgi:uroporphyrinogen decarboxylase